MCAMTFDEISNPYLEQFGFPDQTFDLKMENHVYVQWYWYKEDVVVEFVSPENDSENGWDISFAISLDPLRYYREKESD